MKKQINPTIKAHLIRGAFYVILLLAVCVIPFALAQRNTNKQGAANPSVVPKTKFAAGPLSSAAVAGRQSGAQRMPASAQSQLPYDVRPNQPASRLSNQATSGPSGVKALRILPPPKFPTVVLYDQLDNPGTFLTSSQEFPDIPTFTSFAADDFVVPGGQTWTVTEVDAQGGYLNGTGPADNFNVFFYQDSGGLPGAQIYTATAQSYVDNVGVFQVTLSVPALLTSGTYWVSVQAHMSFTPNGQWSWTDRTVQANFPAAWQNPGGGFGVGCPTWCVRGATIGDPGAPDQMFRLVGTTGGGACNLGPWNIVADYPLISESVSVCSDGTVAYAVGGSAGGFPTNAFNVYDPVADTWTALPNIPGAFYDAPSVYDPTTNSVYVFGGLDATFTPSNVVQIYNVGTGIWTTGTPMPGARYFAGAAYYGGTDKIYVIAGFDSSFTETNTTWEYDPITDTWNTSRANVPTPLGGSGYSIVGQNIYMAGTWNGALGSTVHYRYDIVADTWTAVAPVPVNIYRPDSGAIGTNTYLVGGGNPDLGACRMSPQARKRASTRAPATSYTSTYIYDTTSDSWSTGPNTNVAHSFTGGTAIGNLLIVVTGFDGVTGDTNTVERSDCLGGTPTPTPTASPSPTPTATGSPTCTPGAWQEVAAMPTDLYGAAGASDGTFFYAAGGYSFSVPGLVNEFNRYDPGNNTWTALTPIPTGSALATAVYYPPTNKIYVFGGSDPDAGTVNNLNQIYDIASDTWSAGAPLPDVRGFSAGGYSSDTGMIYILSGYSTGFVTDAQPNTWQYDPGLDTWTDLTGSAPYPHPAGGFAYGVVNGKLYTAGGRDAANLIINDTWEYDPVANTYTQKTDEPATFQNNVPGSAAAQGLLWVFGGGNPFIGNASMSKAGLTSGDVPNKQASSLWSRFQRFLGLKRPATANSGRFYDPATDTWTSSANMNEGRSFPSGGAIGSSLIIAAGGFNGSTTVASAETEGVCGGASPTPTPTATATATATATPTATFTPTATATPTATVPPRSTPTPRPRPTPPPRP